MPLEFRKSCPWYGMDTFWTWLCRTSYEVLHEVHTQKFAFVMYCNAEMILFSDEIHAKMPQKLSKQNHRMGELLYMLLITHAVM